MNHSLNSQVFSRLLSIILLTTCVHAQSFDLTKGSKPDQKDLKNEHWNLGATGLRGWFHRQNRRSADTTKTTQILVTEVAPGSPADKLFEEGDVILGASGNGKAPQPFTVDARKSLAHAIADAEARSPAELKLIQWRSGERRVVALKLRTLGRYSATAPYNCPKSKAVLQLGLEKLMEEDPTFSELYTGIVKIALWKIRQGTGSLDRNQLDDAIIVEVKDILQRMAMREVAEHKDFYARISFAEVSPVITGCPPAAQVRRQKLLADGGLLNFSVAQ